MQEAGDPLHLVRLQHVRAGGRQRPEDQRCGTSTVDGERGEHQPARSRDEEHGGERGAVDERGAEVRLDEDERDRQRGERDGAEHRPGLVDPLPALGEEAREREDEQQLSELRRLEAERAEVEPAAATRASPGPARKTSSITATVPP